MLKLTSRFVLQVLPYLLVALAAVVLLPEVSDSLVASAFRGTAFPAHDIGSMFDPFSQGETTLDLIRQDHEAVAPNALLGEIVKAPDLEDR
jgi:hypothetical protein